MSLNPKNKKKAKTGIGATTGAISATKKKLAISKVVKSLKDSSAALAKGAGGQGVLSSLTPDFERPPFNDKKEKAARLEAALATQNDDYLSNRLDVLDLAAPHRAPYSWLRDRVMKGSDAEIDDLVTKLTDASEHYEKGFQNVTTDSRYKTLAKFYEETRLDVEAKLAKYKVATLAQFLKLAAKLELIQALNNLASNAPGLGPHSGTNQPVSDKLHLHPSGDQGGFYTPRSEAAKEAFPGRVMGTTIVANKRQIVSPTGAHHDPPPSNPGQAYQDVVVKSTVLRAALYVDPNHVVFRPKNPSAKPTGDFNKDWVQVT